MTFDFSRVNWMYVSIATAIWLATAWSVWHWPNGTLSEQFQQFQRRHSESRLSYQDWINLSRISGREGPAPPGRKQALVQLTLLYWFFLAFTLVFGLGVVRW